MLITRIRDPRFGELRVVARLDDGIDEDDD